MRTDTYRASGPGGQHRNTRDTGVRLVHLPTGTTVTATEDRSQHRNRAVAWQRLTATLAKADITGARETMNAQRKEQAQDGSWAWVGWRDEVKGPNGQRCGSMKRALTGKLDPLLATTPRKRG